MSLQHGPARLPEYACRTDIDRHACGIIPTVSTSSARLRFFRGSCTDVVRPTYHPSEDACLMVIDRHACGFVSPYRRLICLRFFCTSALTSDDKSEVFFLHAPSMLTGNRAVIRAMRVALMSCHPTSAGAPASNSTSCTGIYRPSCSQFSTCHSDVGRHACSLLKYACRTVVGRHPCSHATPSPRRLVRLRYISTSCIDMPALLYSFSMYHYDVDWHVFGVCVSY